MKKFKEFAEAEVQEEVPANNMGSGAIAKYDPVMKFKMFRRKPVMKKKKKK